MVPSWARTQSATESPAPLRIWRPLKSTPDMRVCAEKGTNFMPSMRRARRPNWSLARTTMERPSGVSSESDESCAASARSPGRTSGAGKNSVAWRLPSVIVPVLSRSSTLTSPAASTARPDIASTLCWRTRSMPAMPIAESRPPIVVGIRQTSSAIRTGVDVTPCA